MAARSEWILVAEIFLFGVGAPGGSAVDLLSKLCSQVFGAVLRGYPSPEFELRRLRVSFGSIRAVFAGRWLRWRWMEAHRDRVRRLPGRGGAVPYPRREGSSGGGAPAYVLVVVFVNGLLRDFVVFFTLSQDLSVRTL